MAKFKFAVGNLGAEESAQVKRIVLTRDDTKAQADELFGAPAKAMRVRDRRLLEVLFNQMPAAVTMAPNLQKQGAVQTAAREKIKQSAAKNVMAFFEKKAYLTDAQRRYPELLKVSSIRGGDPSKPVPNLHVRKTTETTGQNPRRATLSGGSA